MLSGWLSPQEENYHSLLALLILTAIAVKAPHHLVKPADNTTWKDRPSLAYALVLFGVFTQLLGLVAGIVFLQQLSLVVLTWGLVGLYTRQRPTGYGFLLSLFLVQAIPWLIVTPLTLPLKVASTTASAGLAQAIGWPVAFTQNLIEVNGLALQVTSPCSGLHSIVGLTFVWLLIGLVNSLPLRWVLAGLPAAWLVGFLANCLRLFLTLAWAVFISPHSTLTAHDVLGYLTFALGTVGLIALAQRRKPA